MEVEAFLPINNNEDISEIDDFEASKKELKKEHRVLPVQKVSDMMQSVLLKVCDVTDLTECEARSLLNDFHWDSEKLLEKIYEDSEETRKMLKDNFEVVSCDTKYSLNCSICFDTVRDPRSIHKFRCNHRFCVSCLADYLTKTIRDENAIKCPKYLCRYELEDQDVFAVIKDPLLIEKYQQIVTNSFVQHHRLMKWCPNQEKCKNIIYVESGSTVHAKNEFTEGISCSCGYSFCFDCSAESHEPVSCVMLQKWNQIVDGSTNVRWDGNYAEECPVCQSQTNVSWNIWKSVGCKMHACQNCPYTFCLVCKGQWNETHFCLDACKYQYNVMKVAYEDVIKEAYEDDAEYYAGDAKQAVQTLLQCRRTLMHCYIFRFFVTSSDGQQISNFEGHLETLKQNTEQLAISMKDHIILGADLCLKSRHDLLDYVKNGFENGLWLLNYDSKREPDLIETDFEEMMQ